MKKLFISICVAAALCGCKASVLEKEGWSDDVYASLSEVIRSSGKGDYAIFDCDNTTVINDVSHVLMVWQIENLEFRDAPEHLFLDGVDDISVVLNDRGETAEELGTVLRDEYRSLKSMLSDGVPLEKIHECAAYLDFRARFMALYKSIGRKCDTGTLLLWMPALMAGFTTSEASEIVDKETREWIAEGRTWDEEWVSPDSLYSGTAHKGLVLTSRMRNLYKALERRKIDAYVCSASLEMFVKVLLCDPEIGLGLPEERIYGIRLLEKDRKIIGEYDPDYPQPYREGKVLCINKFISPHYGGRGPVLVAGDSSGDVPMLTGWSDTRASLIMDRGLSGDIGVLSARATLEGNSGRYLSQPK